MTDSARHRWWNGLVRRKGHIDPRALSLLLAAGCLPLILAFSRILAFPGAESLPIFGIDQLRGLGQVLNQSLSLEWVPPSDRPAILYLLLLPTGALLIALARLTFGLRVLGLRAILLAIGFQESGFLGSLGLMAIVIGTIVAIRPSMRRIRLPLYGRLAVILCLTAMIMVGALLIGPWVHSDAVWGIAFFPVIIMAMLAEGIAKTLANDSAVTAAWRAGWTILVALVIAMIGQLTIVGSIALRFPELLLTELVAIVLISEFLDLRLLEQWPARLTRLLQGVRPWYTDKPRVAVVRNRWNSGVIGRLGSAAPAKYRKRSVQPVVDVLREQGFRVRVFEADMSLLRELSEFLPPDPRSGAPGGIVLNLATGTQGNGRFCQVPAMLEMAGIAYTGPDPVVQSRLIDRQAVMTLLQRSAVPVPRFSLMSSIDEQPDLGFPLAVRPRCEPDVARTVVTDRVELEQAVARIRESYDQDAFVEEVIDGREFRVCMLGNEVVESLPLLEYLAGNRRKTCPAPISDVQAERVRAVAYRAYKAAGCRDYARIDVRLSGFGVPRVIDVKWADLLQRRGSFVRSAEAAGLTFGVLVHRIIEEASMRYDGVVIRQGVQDLPGAASVVSLADRRLAAK